MKSFYIVFAAPLIMLSHYGFADEVSSTTPIQSDWLEYRDRVQERYLTVLMYHDEKLVRTLSAEIDKGGAFESEVPLRMSPDGHYIYLSQIESAVLETPNGPKTVERAYCNIADVRSGCIIARETGAFCGGTFTNDGKWKNSLYSDLNLAKSAPKAIAYANGKLTPGGSSETTLDNLIECDPPNTNNAEEYSRILNKNIFNLNAAQQDALRNKLTQQRDPLIKLKKTQP